MRHSANRVPTMHKPSSGSLGTWLLCPFLCQIPMKFRAHFEFPELRKATEEELEKFQAEKDEQDAAAAAAQERLEAERAAEAKAAE